MYLRHEPVSCMPLCSLRYMFGVWHGWVLQTKQGGAHGRGGQACLSPSSPERRVAGYLSTYYSLIRTRSSPRDPIIRARCTWPWRGATATLTPCLPALATHIPLCFVLFVLWNGADQTGTGTLSHPFAWTEQLTCSTSSSSVVPRTMTSGTRPSPARAWSTLQSSLAAGSRV